MRSVVEISSFGLRTSVAKLPKLIDIIVVCFFTKLLEWQDIGAKIGKSLRYFGRLGPTLLIKFVFFVSGINSIRIWDRILYMLRY